MSIHTQNVQAVHFELPPPTRPGDASLANVAFAETDVLWLHQQAGFNSDDPDEVRHCVIALIRGGAAQLARILDESAEEIPGRLLQEILRHGYRVKDVPGIWREFAEDANVRSGRCRSLVQRQAKLQLWLAERARRLTAEGQHPTGRPA